MFNEMKSKGLLWPALMTVLGIALLLGLGTWQLKRLEWKQGLIADIAARSQGEPVTLANAEARKGSGEGIEYLRVATNGRFLHDKEIYLYAHDSRYGPGYHVITPLVMADGSVVFVNRGYVPLELKDAAKRLEGQVSGEVEVVGLVREAEIPGAFTPANDVDKNIWYWRDLDAMATTAFGADQPRLASFMVDAEAEPLPPGGWPRGGTTRVELPNRHLEYALTWYGLAVALLAVFVFFAISRLERPVG